MNKSISRLIFLLYDSMKRSGILDLREVYIVKDLLQKEEVKEKLDEKEIEEIEKIDLIVIYNDYNKIIDDHIILALKIECIDERSNIKERLEKSIKEIPLIIKCYNLGFDSTCIWHYFSREVKEQIIRDFCIKVNEAISKMELPIIHLATKIMIGNTYKLFSPDEIDARSEVTQLIQMIQNIIRDKKRLPQKYVDRKFLESRDKLKRMLKVKS